MKLQIISAIIVFSALYAPSARSASGIESQTVPAPEARSASINDPGEAEQQANAPSIRGRVPKNLLASIIADVDHENDNAAKAVLATADPLSRDLRAMLTTANSYPNFRGDALLLPTEVLQKKLGKSLQPKSLDDISEMIGAFEKAARRYGQFANDPNLYTVISSLKAAIGVQQDRLRQIEDARNKIIQIELELDKNDLTAATSLLQDLTQDTVATHFTAVQRYIFAIRSLPSQTAESQTDARNNVISSQSKSDAVNLSTHQEAVGATAQDPRAGIGAAIRISPGTFADVLRMSEPSHSPLSPALVTMSGQVMQVIDKQAEWAADPNVQMNRPEALDNLKRIMALRKRMKGRHEAQTLSEAEDIHGVYVACGLNEYGWINPGREEPDDLGKRFGRDLSSFKDMQDNSIGSIKQIETDLDRQEIAHALFTYETLRASSGSNTPFVTAYLNSTASMYPALLVKGHVLLHWHPSNAISDIPGRATRDQVQEILSRLAKENPAYSAEIGNTVDRIIAIENALDAKEFTNASDGFKTLSLGSTPTVPEAASYIELSRALRDDLETYSSIDKEHQRKDLTLIEDVGMIAREATLLEAAKDKPLTLALLKEKLLEDDSKLKSRIDATSPLQLDEGQYTHLETTSTMIASARVDESLLKSRIALLTSKIANNSEIAALARHADLVALISQRLGDASAQTVMARAAEVNDANRVLDKLNQRLTEIEARLEKAERDAEAARQQAQEEEARQKALIAERNNLAGTIWNKVLMITMLDEKFNLTEKMGYTMEADKQRTALNGLLRQDHAMLTPSLWGEVNQEYQRILPGLTVWQASHARSIIAGLHSFGR